MADTGYIILKPGYPMQVTDGQMWIYKVNPPSIENINSDLQCADTLCPQAYWSIPLCDPGIHNVVTVGIQYTNNQAMVWAESGHFGDIGVDVGAPDNDECLYDGESNNRIRWAFDANDSGPMPDQFGFVLSGAYESQSGALAYAGFNGECYQTPVTGPSCTPIQPPNPPGRGIKLSQFEKE